MREAGRGTGRDEAGKGENELIKAVKEEEGPGEHKKFS